MRKIETHGEHHVVVASEDVFHLRRLGVDHMAGAIVTSGETALATSIEGHVGQRKDVRVVALVQIELLFYRLA